MGNPSSEEVTVPVTVIAWPKADIPKNASKTSKDSRFNNGSFFIQMLFRLAYLMNHLYFEI
ncbi:MAG: hypothetical protein AMS26_13420 [Bacteroides sp. SM23_62]|nr:MAG: hypothetical protein AMS26_13420 [Bacteroides sp. SM23_62]